MAADQRDVPIPARTVTLLTPNGPCSAARIQARGRGLLRVQATPTATPPAASAFGGAIDLMAGQAHGFEADVTLATRYPGAITTTGYLWGWSEEAMEASVSHA